MQISTIIPTYNRLSYVLRAVKSVVAQTKQSDEIIVVDNGSSDATEQEVKNQFPSVKYILEKTKGVSRARNRGISSAKYDWIALLDSDDVWKKNKLERVAFHLKQSPDNYGVWHSDEIWIRNGKHLNQKRHHQKNGGYLFGKCLKSCCVSPSSALIHKSIFNKYGFFDESLEVCEDYDFWLRVAVKECFGFINEKLVVKYGGHDDQLSKKFWGMDRYRVKSLINLVENSDVNKKQKTMIQKEIVYKLNVLIAGAKNRNNLNLQKVYEPILAKWLTYD